MSFHPFSSMQVYFECDINVVIKIRVLLSTANKKVMKADTSDASIIYQKHFSDLTKNVAK